MNRILTSKTLLYKSLLPSTCRLTIQRAAFSAPAAAPSPAASSPSTESNPKIESIVDEISKMSLVEVSELVSALKTRLNIQDSAMAMPMMAASMNASAAGGEAPAAAVEEEKPVAKSEFTVKLEKIDAAQKAKVIREIKNIITGCNLVEAKKFVESAPKVVKENVPKEEAEKMKKLLESVGATVVLE